MQNLISAEPRRNGARTMGKLRNRAALVIALAVAIIAAAVALDLASAAAQSEEQAGRIVAQRLADGRTEFGWQPAGGARVLPTARYFPTDAEVDRWLNSSPVEVEGEAIGRINARLQSDGRIEFAFTPTDGERILTDARYFPAAPRPNRWLRSTEITIGPPQLDNPFIALVASYYTACALRESGWFGCWGYAPEHSDMPVGSIIAIANNCAIVATFESATSGTTAPGEIECWGDPNPDYGQTDAPAGLFTAVATSTFNSCGLRENGAIECWGDNSDGQADAPEGHFIAVSTGEGHICAIRESGAIECWGLNNFGQTDPPAGRFSAVSAGHDSTCAIRAGNGAIECWGSNEYTFTGDYAGKLDAPAGRFSAVSAGSDHTCAIRDTGAIECWGDNEWGQLDAPAGSFTAVSAGLKHTCAIRESGAVECWGENHYGLTDNAPTQ